MKDMTITKELKVYREDKSNLRADIVLKKQARDGQRHLRKAARVYPNAPECGLYEIEQAKEILESKFHTIRMEWEHGYHGEVFRKDIIRVVSCDDGALAAMLQFELRIFRHLPEGTSDFTPVTDAELEDTTQLIQSILG